MAPDGDIFKPSHNVFNSTNVTRKSYRDYLSGNLEEHSGRFSAIKFDDVAIDIGGGYLITSTGKLSQAAAGPLTMIPTFQTHLLCAFQNKVSMRSLSSFMMISYLIQVCCTMVNCLCPSMFIKQEKLCEVCMEIRR